MRTTSSRSDACPSPWGRRAEHSPLSRSIEGGNLASGLAFTGRRSDQRTEASCDGPMTLKTKSLLAAAFLGAAAMVAVPSPPAAGEQTRGAVFENGLPSAPSYFPISVWLQSPRLAPKYKAIGVNLFMGLYQGPTEDQLAELAKYDMPVIANQNDVGLHSPHAKMIRGWMQDWDEPDNAQPLASGSWGPCVPAKTVALQAAAIKAKDPTRPVLTGFGRGVADPDWRGRGSCKGDMAYYDVAAVGADILAFDIYPVASGYGAQLDLPSRGIKRLREAAKDGQHVWAVIETTRINSQARVTPAQLRSEVLLALIQGADGLLYFAHEWTGGFREDGLFRYPEIVQAVKDTNALVKRLAPVLNSPTIEGRIAASGTIPTATMLKEREGDLYLFAGSTDSKAGSVSFSLSGFSNGRAEAIDEDRQIPITNGAFSDSFDRGYDVHVYRIKGGDRP